MTAMLMTAPILTGKVDAWRRFVGALLGERHDVYRAAIRAAGLDRLRVWLQNGPDGAAAATILFEGPAPERFLQGVATGADDFSAWFRASLAEAHGIDMSAPPPPPPELAIDERAAGAGAGAATYSCSKVKVQSYAAWRRVMDELRPLRVEHGQVSEEILRSAEDEHEVTVLLGWQSEERARRYYGHPELRAGVERAGGVDGRGMTFLVPG